LAAGSGK